MNRIILLKTACVWVEDKNELAAILLSDKEYLLPEIPTLWQEPPHCTTEGGLVDTNSKLASGHKDWTNVVLSLYVCVRAPHIKTGLMLHKEMGCE